VSACVYGFRDVDPTHGVGSAVCCSVGYCCEAVYTSFLLSGDLAPLVSCFLAFPMLGDDHSRLSVWHRMGGVLGGCGKLLPRIF